MIRKTLLLLAAVALSGCITVFPKTKPAQLYRFDGADEVSATPGAAAIAEAGRGMIDPTTFLSSQLTRR